MATTGIYRIAVADGRCYIGQSVDIEARWRGHRCDLRKHRHHARHLQRAWDELGESAVAFEVVEECPVELLGDRELYWLLTLRPAFNMRTNGGAVLTLAQRAAKSAAQKGRPKSPEHRAKIALALKGHSPSPETRAKMSLSARNRARETRVWSEATRAKVLKLGRTISPENRAKLNAGKVGKPLSPQHRAALSATHAGRPKSPEHAAKIAASLRAYYAAPGRRPGMRTKQLRQAQQTPAALSSLHRRDFR